MELARHIAEIRSLVRQARKEGQTIGVVPTMGALHAGHGELLRQARNECAYVVATIFVNPTQFDRHDDYQLYPRNTGEDLQYCLDHHVDAVFSPDAAEMYPEPGKTTVEVEALARHLCGAFRPGHFRGVATVVAKLFQIVQPDYAYFGEKDAQQLAIIERMTADLNIPVTIRPVPTVREPDGLAISSRNLRLTAEQRQAAPVVFRALELARQKVADGCQSASEARAAAMELFDAEPAARVEYLEFVDPATISPVETIAGAVRIAAAVWIGPVRLIDNVLAARMRPGNL